MNINQTKELPAKLTGLTWSGKFAKSEKWSLGDGEAYAAVPFEVAAVDLQGGKSIASAGDKPLIIRNAVGQGAVIVVLVPHGLGMDERAHPCLPALMNALTEDLVPIDVRLKNGARPNGEIMYSFNKTKDGWLVSLFNQRGIDKTQNGIARVDRRAFVDVVVRTKLNVISAREMTEPLNLVVTKGEIGVRVPAGDMQVIALKMK